MVVVVDVDCVVVVVGGVVGVGDTIAQLVVAKINDNI